MTEVTRDRLLSLLSLVAVAALVYFPARAAWDRASTPPPEDHGLAALAGVPPPPGAPWACVIDAISGADLPGTAAGFAVAVNADEELDVDLIIERALGGDLPASIALDGLVVSGLPTDVRVPLDCGTTG